MEAYVYHELCQNTNHSVKSILSRTNCLKIEMLLTL